MEALKVIRTPAISLLIPNINTDVIMPSREMRKVERTGLKEGIFADWRYLPGSRDPDPNFIMNDERFESAQIILGGENFGCGSSREFAVWGLYEYGFRVIIAPSFGNIFYKNCIVNGILPAIIEHGALEVINDYCLNASPLEINLETKTIIFNRNSLAFDIDNHARNLLLEGLDQIDRTLGYTEKIDTFINDDKKNRSWVYESKIG